MKIRSGFVSNSSSSSFIVAFPKKPTTKTDVSEMMFPNNPHGSIPNPWTGLSEHDQGLGHAEIVEQVFTDIGKEEKVSNTELLSELSGRYFILDKKLYYEGAAYFAVDKDLTKMYIDSHNEHEQQEKEYDSFRRELIKKHLGPPVQYASDATMNWKTKKKYTAEEIEEYKTYSEKEKEFCKTNEEYITAEQNHNKRSLKHWDTQRKLTKKLAKVDLDAFKKDNTGAFITRFTYSDNDGTFFSLMEHGGIFKNLHHIIVSHH